MALIIPIDRIATDGTQSRAELNTTVIDEYAEAYKEGIELPPIDVYFDEETYWLADGFHRIEALKKIDRDSITANVHEGGKREAIFHAVGANETHGLRRTNADRRHAVHILLTDPEWSRWANTEIARQCNVSEFHVRTIRSELTPIEEVERGRETRRKARRGGKTFEQNVTRIGKSRSRKKAVVAVPHDEGLQPHEEEGPLTHTPSSILSKMDDGTPDVHAALIEPDVPATAADHEPVPTPDVPPEPPPVGEPRPDADATTLPVEVAEQYSVEDAWAWAGRAEREAFVVEHRRELKKIIAKIERKKAVSS